MQFEFMFGRLPERERDSPEADTPLRILVLGNFSGGVAAADANARPPLQQRPIVRIDIDQFDSVLRRFAPKLCLGGVGTVASTEIEFHELDDFRPERLGEKSKTFRELQELRRKLLNPKTFAEAATQLRQELAGHAALPERSVVAPPSPPAMPAEDDAALLRRLIGQPAKSAPPAGHSGRSSSGIERLIQQAVQPYIVPAADPHQDVYLAAVDRALGDQIRAVLHAPAFQALEATWRSLHGLISIIEDESAIQVHLLDVALDELRADSPTDDERLRQWGIYRRLTDGSGQASGTAPWSLIVGDFSIGARPQDLALLGALAATAENLQTPLIAAAGSTLLGCPSLVECPDPADWQPLDAEARDYWQALRRSSAAAWIGLVLPRVLLRLPYGKATDVVESFAFEEFTTARRHEDYLWGNPAYLCAGLIAQAFAETGWSLELGSQLDIGNLPAHIYHEDGEAKLQACAEVAFGERTAEAILQRGLMPLLSWKDRDAVRFVRFQSIADPIAPLAGVWS
jgi:type VI secretion system ImpC/EvpB family protein/type VI secretion system ImpB/VipA family protein